VRFQVFIGDRIRNISGTSASAPAIAGIFAKLNDQRLKAHLPPLGFVNPLIYRFDYAVQRSLDLG
jgi:tripeptidyl-peptidase-1